MRERHQAIAFLLAWGASLVLLLSGIAAITPKPVSPATASAVRLLVHGPSWSIDYEASTQNNTAFGLLREANATLGFELRWVPYGWPYYDVLVTSINGTASDSGRNLWWQYCVDGTYASVGASNQEIRTGDVVTWVYAAPGGNELCV